MDKISNLLISIKNSGAIGKEKISVPFSGITLAVSNVLKEEGYVKAVQTSNDGRSISVVLDYDMNKNHKVQDVKRISKPGKRVYYKLSDIQKVRQGYGTLVLSTPQGVMTGKAARAANTGGEALFEIY